MLPLDPDAALGITQIRLNGPIVVLEAAALTASAPCPGCGVLSGSIHDRYVRRPLDLPWRGRVVRLQLTVPPFRGTAVAGPRATFAEGFGPRLPRRAWRTAEADALLLRCGWTAGGEAGAPLARDAAGA